MRSIRFELLRPDELIAERHRCPIIFLPIGPLEWHSLHLPYGTDPLNAEGIARRTAEQVGGVVLPTLYCGTERERLPQKLLNLGFEEDQYIVGMDFPAHSLPSLYTHEEIFAIQVRNYMEMINRLEYALIVIVNGHGGRNHLETLRRLTLEFNTTYSAKVLLAFAMPALVRGGVGHADSIETSIMMAMHPDSVDLSSLPPLSESLPYRSYGIVDSRGFSDEVIEDHIVEHDSDPRFSASADTGQAIIQQSVSELVKTIYETMQEMKIGEFTVHD